MAKLSSGARKALPKSDFAGPDRSYPVPDKSHAANAKSRASQAVNAGRMSPSTEAKIDTKANKVLGQKPQRGERTAKNNETRHPGSHDEWQNME
jgi:hypothetical protein